MNLSSTNITSSGQLSSFKDVGDAAGVTEIESWVVVVVGKRYQMMRQVRCSDSEKGLICICYSATVKTLE